MRKISIIMPLYNAEKYLPEALQCIVAQTYRNFELICIDDCSTDATLEILMDFQRIDSRIRIMNNEERLGAGSSRNKGLRAAQGEFIIFLDGDDIFSRKLLEITCRAMEQHSADVVLFDAVKHVESEEIHIEKTIEYPKEYVEQYCQKAFCIHDFPVGKFPLWADSVGDKMFLKSFIMEQHLEFQDLPSSNDVYFVRMALYCAGKVIWAQSEKALLYTRAHSEPSRISNDRDPMCAYYAWEKVAEELTGRNMFRDIQEHFYTTFSSTLLNYLRNEKNKERQKKFYLFLQTKGISKCIKHNGIDTDKMDAYALYILDSIQKNTYESGWFNSVDTCFQFYVKKNGERICRFISEKISQNRTIILWGAGVNGTAILEYLTENFIRIAGVVDCNEKKQGTIVCGYEIGKPVFMCLAVDYILVTSQEVYWEVSVMMKDTDVKLVNLLDLLTEG